MRFRIVWLLIIVPYFFIFFFNRFHGTPNQIYPLLFSYTLVGWLAFEFYFRNSFFQAGLIPIDEYPYWLKIITAAYFYGSFVLANFEIEKSGANPNLGIIGLILLFIGVAVRIMADLELIRFRKKFYENGVYKIMRQPVYLGLILISLAIGLCFNSITVLIITCLIGMPLFYFESKFEDNYLARKDSKFGNYQRRVKYFGII